MSKSSLAETHPELAKEWHPTKNGELTPGDVTFGAKKKVWWKCDKAEDHDYQAPIQERSRGRGCPYCSGKRVALSNCLATTDIELSKKWHPTKNKDLTPFDILRGSGRKVWWKCDVAEDHEWEGAIHKTKDCPCCSGRKVVFSNSLYSTNPEIAKDWHPTKNGNLKPTDLTKGSSIKVWWKCHVAEDHEWKTSPTDKVGCPCCSGAKLVLSTSLQSTHPEITKYWHPTKNENLEPKDFSRGSSKIVWWKCPKADDHEYKASIKAKTQGDGCPICRGLQVVKSNSLAFINSEKAKKWHPTKNGELTPFNFTSKSHKKAWWKCDVAEDHEWEARIADSVGCPCCSGAKIVLSNCLQTTHPHLVKEWHSAKNGNLNPRNFIKGSSTKIWWQCPEAEDHIYQSTIVHRALSGSNCPYCAGHKVSMSNCLQTTHPEYAKQWHPIKNGKLKPTDVTSGSNKMVWWKCPEADDHIWRTKPNTRASHIGGCPMCLGRIIVKSNCLGTKNPLLSNEWHPIKNGKINPFNVAPFAIKKVWWQCTINDDHVWKAQISNRSSGAGCPFCFLTPQSKQELIITFELITIFKDIDPKGFKTEINGKIKAIDIFIPLLNLAIEFDGSFWHKDKLALDKIKSEMLMDEGYKVIRIREEPLKKIHENDIVSTHPYNGKEITDNILKRILETNDIFKIPMLNKMYEYLKKDSLQNEKGLDRYIDQILTEKAEKREQLN